MRGIRTFATVASSATKKYKLHNIGIQSPSKVHYNLSYLDLYNHEVSNNEGTVFTSNGTPVVGVDTGKYTGRSPKDRWIVNNPESNNNIWWGNINQPTSNKVFDEVVEKAISHFNTLDSVYLYDGYCGANKQTRRHVRFVHELAWQQHFVKNMFIESDKCKDSEPIYVNDPDITILNACSIVNDEWEKHGLNSDTAIIFNIERKLGVILGTWYGGENKKGIFSLMNYWLPLSNIMSMHCSANVGKNNDTALFFGLSGTGKTTLSADSSRYLIGDDEHGWDDDGIFNLEGGCYAKTINLEKKNEPEIWDAIKTNALLENVAVDKSNTKDNIPDYKNVEKTQNGRVSYPICHIDNWYPHSIAPHPKNIIFLTCDAFGVLPPVAKLNMDQAMFHFLSGYTSKVAGTERGVTEPEATFSTCFGAAFMTLHPTVYADLLKKKIETHKCNTYLVNTGWIGGPYGIGDRISIKDTRFCIDSILDGSIESLAYNIDQVFGFQVPHIISDSDQHIYDTRATWVSPTAYDMQAESLKMLFLENYEQYKCSEFSDYSKTGLG